jgi:hypothetical protein
VNDNLLVCVADRPYTNRDVIPIWLEPHDELENVWQYTDDPEPVRLAPDGYAWGIRIDCSPPAISAAFALDLAIDLYIDKRPVYEAEEKERAEKKQRRRERRAERERVRSALRKRQRRIERLESRMAFIWRELAVLQETDWHAHFDNTPPQWQVAYKVMYG